MSTTCGEIYKKGFVTSVPLKLMSLDLFYLVNNKPGGTSSNTYTGTCLCINCYHTMCNMALDTSVTVLLSLSEEDNSR